MVASKVFVVAAATMVTPLAVGGKIRRLNSFQRFSMFQGARLHFAELHYICKLGEVDGETVWP